MTLKLGVFGGSGVYNVKGMKVVGEHTVKTPFGDPSDSVFEAETETGKRVFFMSRHARGHRLTPSEINYRANIYAMKELGVTHLLGVSAVGILQADITPGDFVIPDQIFGRTRGRASTFFGDGLVGHVTFADPFCSKLSKIVQEIAEKHAKVHYRGTYLAMEGPQFSTRAESIFYHKVVGARVIGMTGAPEAGLAREAELSYVMLALATDYDSWHQTEADVAVTDVLKVLHENAERSMKVVLDLANHLGAPLDCSCQHAAQYAIVTDRSMISPAMKEKFSVLFGRYL